MSDRNLPRAIIAVEYAEAAHDYLRSLPPEHFMEATAQATQRKITLESLDLVHDRRPEVQVFNELLVQYERPRQRRPGQIVPDNMVVVWKEPITADGSYDVPLEPCLPLWVLEYVSKFNKRKDYEKSFDKYEQELKIPYYLIFYPDNQELTLYHLVGGKYRSVKPNEQDRYSLPELSLEMALLDGWVRYWFEGKLLPLPADLQRDLDEVKRQLKLEKRRAEREKLRAEREKLRAEREKLRADQATQSGTEARQQLLEEQQARQALERELQKLRTQLKQ